MKDLQIDHVDPSEKVTHKVWSWSEPRREEELNKCVVRCKPCHIEKTQSNNEGPYAERISQSRLTSDQVREIRRRVSEGESRKSVREEFGLSTGTISDIINWKTWKRYIPG